jgi:hypothetical protein
MIPFFRIEMSPRMNELVRKQKKKKKKKKKKKEIPR